MAMDDERFPQVNRQKKPNIVTNGQFISEGNSVHLSATNVIVTGSENCVSEGCKNIGIFNSSGCVVLPGVHGATLINSSGVIVSDNDKFYYNNIDQSSVSGTYTPTVTNLANLDALTAYSCQWSRVGSVVTVSGKIDLNPTLTATSTRAGISFPIASNLGSDEDCAGAAFSPTVASMGAAIVGDKNNDTAMVQFISSDMANNSFYFTFTYRII